MRPKFNIGFNPEKVSRMCTTDKWYEWGRALDCQFDKFQYAAKRRMEKYADRSSEVWFRKEAEARKRLILKLVLMIEHMELP